jgi:uncharacterized C2H2 Zn-finger protein
MPDTRCPSCGQAFPTKGEADDHMTQMHGGKKGGERENDRKDAPRLE